ncbi:MAG TPA: VanZ family protein [Aquabacterium sp.]|nr:VanZ family protein [Aquabacterium sp.]
MSTHRSSAWPLTWVAVALIVYATLHPLTGWHWPDRQVFSWLLPKLPHETTDDLVGNILGYLPLGLILCVAHLRSGASAPMAVGKTLLFGTTLSYALELTQFALPTRVPSITDWVLNTLGVAWGTLAAITVHALGVVDWWHGLRQRWFIQQAGHGLALLWLWPLGLLFPPPLPLGEGQLLPPVRLMLVDWTAGTPLQAWLLPEDPLRLWANIHAGVVASSWLPVVEALTVAAGMLAPLCVACALARPRVLRIGLLSGLVLIAVGGTALSTALNFGPQHAFSWVTLPASIGLLAGAGAGLLLVQRSRITCAVLGVGVLLTLIGLIHLAPPDPYYAQTLQAWEHGRFIRFHGLARWFGLLWPYVALLWLLGRLGSRDLHQPEVASGN